MKLLKTKDKNILKAAREKSHIICRGTPAEITVHVSFGCKENRCYYM